MHNRVVFPDFSAFQMTIAGAPAEPQATGKPAAAEAPREVLHRPRPAGVNTKGQRSHITAPPFSWLGGDAWPNLPARADEGH